MTYEEEQSFNDAYRKANDWDYQKRIQDNCNLKNWARKYETLLSRPFCERSCDFCQLCFPREKTRQNEIICNSKLQQRIKDFIG